MVKILDKPFIEGYIYAVECLTTGDRYVGQSARMDEYAIKSYHGKFGSKLSKKNRELFKKDILENHITDKSEYNRLEQKYIAEYRELYGLEVMWRNIDDGGNVQSHETRKKQSAAKRGKCGHRHTIVTRKKQSIAKLGKKLTKEHCKSMSNAHLGKLNPSSYVKCSIDNIEYDSFGFAMIALNLTYAQIKYRINSDKYTTYIRVKT